MAKAMCPICHNGSIRVGKDGRLVDHYGPPDITRLAGVRAQPCRGSGRRVEDAKDSG